MKNIKIVTITLALMTSSAFADFTIKDLFISGGTQTIQDGTKDSHDKSIHEDCK